jgi:hypothetical protein
MGWRRRWSGVSRAERRGRRRAGVVCSAARRRGEASTQMCSEAVEMESSSLCELRDGMQEICMQGPSCLDCRRPRATGWGCCPVNGAEVQAD